MYLLSFSLYVSSAQRCFSVSTWATWGPDAVFLSYVGYACETRQTYSWCDLITFPALYAVTASQSVSAMRGKFPTDTTHNCFFCFVFSLCSLQYVCFMSRDLPASVSEQKQHLFNPTRRLNNDEINTTSNKAQSRELFRFPSSIISTFKGSVGGLQKWKQTLPQTRKFF